MKNQNGYHQEGFKLLPGESQKLKETTQSENGNRVSSKSQTT